MPRWPAAVPSLVIGLTVAAYWYRVARMAIKARRRSGRAANFVPRERLGRLLRVVWGPVVAVWIAGPLLAGLLSRLPGAFRPIWHSPVVAWVGAGLVVAGFLLTRACWKRMGTSWRMGIDPGERTPLVATGPFAYVRHPIYALSIAMMLATVAAVPSPVMLVAGPVHVLLLVWEARREEQHLLRAHGETYRDYRSRVGGFWPVSFRPYSAPVSAG